MNKWKFMRLLLAADNGAGSGGGGTPPAGGDNGGTGGTPPAGNGNQGSGTPPALDPAIISRITQQAAEESQKGFLSSLGFSSMDELKTALAKGKPGPKDGPDPAEVAQQQVAALQRQLEDRDITDAIHRALSGKELNDPDMVSQSLRSSIVYTKDGKVIVRDGNGNTRYNPKTGNPLTVSELADEFLTGKPWLLKTPVRPGPGIDPSKTSSSGYKAPDYESELAEIGKNNVISMADIDRIRAEQKRS